MDTIRMLNRFGLWEYRRWDYDPKNNSYWASKAKFSLKKQGIIGRVYEVAPECFWYFTKTKRINCGLYNK